MRAEESAGAAPSVVALIPARSGSKRVPGKNVRLLGGHPLLAYTISAARSSGIFSKVVVSTDSEEYAAVARHYGAEVPVLRPAEMAGDLSPDIEWVAHILAELERRGDAFDCFSILRPTSPFRMAETIRRAWDQFRSDPEADSLRAVELCRQHPGKMWVIEGNRMHPLLSQPAGETPWHSSQYQALPTIHVQNASLEIAHTRVVKDESTIAGSAVMPFLTQGVEGVDVNDVYDWLRAEHLLNGGEAILPDVSVQPYTRSSVPSR